MYDPNADPELLKLDTDLCLFGDEGFRPFAMKVRAFSPAYFAGTCWHVDDPSIALLTRFLTNF